MAFAFRKTGIAIVTQCVGSRSPIMPYLISGTNIYRTNVMKIKKSVPPHLCRNRCCSVPALLEVEVQPLGRRLNASHRSRPSFAFHCTTSLRDHEPSAKNTLHYFSADKHISFPQSLFVDSLQQL